MSFERPRFIIALTYSSESEWVKNVLAAGGCELKTRGKRNNVQWIGAMGSFGRCGTPYNQ
jgi:hypothetical protein